MASSCTEWKNLGNFLRVDLPSNQSTVVPLVEDMTVYDLVKSTCTKRQLEPDAYFLKLGLEDSSGNMGMSYLYTVQLRNTCTWALVQIPSTWLFAIAST